MKDIRIRDVIGPVMIGPSSSHTAGALRIALMAQKLIAGTPTSVTFKLYGSFAHTYNGHGTDKALLAGILGMQPDDEEIRNSFEIARKRGLDFTFIPVTDIECDHPNTVDIFLTNIAGDTCFVRGESIGGGAAVIRQIDGVDVRLSGDYHSIVVKQHDVKGVLAHIATCMGIFDINIATTRLFRERKGDIAYTIMETDEPIPSSIIPKIATNPHIISVRIIERDNADALGASYAHAPAEPIEPALSAEEIAREREIYDFTTGQELSELCHTHNLTISQAMLKREEILAAEAGETYCNTHTYLEYALDVMHDSAHNPIINPVSSMGGLIGGEAKKLSEYESHSLCDPLLARATTYAMAVLETNASMGRIVAAPTAGSAGVIPSMLLACKDIHHITRETLISALANAAAIGYLITRNATVSGAEGGCQAEVGAASAMAASAAVEMMGGTPEQCLNAAGNAIAGILGLVCDPIAGLVEAPCQKRNATGVANALVSAQMALAHIGNIVDFDQTVDAMYAVGRSLPFELRESALGGLAATPAACSFCQESCTGSCK